MARSNKSVGTVEIVQPRKKRKGVHAKNKSSKNVISKNYKKPYRGQGR